MLANGIQQFWVLLGRIGIVFLNPGKKRDVGEPACPTEHLETLLVWTRRRMGERRAFGRNKTTMENI